MKKPLLFLLVTFSVFYSADAQWYNKACGVADINNCTPAEFQCLWDKASKIARVGAITTGVGTSLVAVGAIMIFGSGFGESGHAGVALGMVGIVVDVIIGVPVWITGDVRKSQLRKNIHYEALNSRSFNLSPSINRIQFNNKYSVGLTASLRF